MLSSVITFIRSKNVVALFVTGVAAVGVGLLISTHASTPTSSSEAESGLLNSACLKKTNPSVSGGAYVRFDTCTSPTTTYKAQIWSPNFMGYCPDGASTCGDMSLTQPDKFKTIIGFTQSVDTINQWKSLGIKVFYYINGCCSTPNDLGPNGDGASHIYPESSYAHTASGSRITIKAFPTNSLMDPRDATWQQSLVKKCQHWAKKLPIDGCFYDTIGIAPLGAGYVTPGVAIDPNTNAPWTNSNYIDAINNEMSLVKSGNTGKLIYGNGLQKGSTYYSDTAQLYNQLDGGMAELFVKAPTQPPSESEADWKKNVDMLIDAKNRGKDIIVTTKAWEEWADPPISTTRAQEDSWHKYALATFMLGSSDKTYFSYQYTHSKSSPLEWQSWWDVDYGAPIDTYSKDVSGVYVRSFAKAKIVVNPSPTQTITYALGGNYQTIDTKQTVSSVTLSPRTAEIVTK